MAGRQDAARFVAHRNGDRDGIGRVAYEDTEQFQVSREFLAAPARMLAVLLSDEE